MNRPSSYNECYIPSSVLLEADGCCIDLNECASSSKQRNSNDQHSPASAGWLLLTTKTRRDLCLVGFFQDRNKKVVIIVVCVHSSLKVAEELLCSLVYRVSLVRAFRSLTIRYEISAQSGREESSSVNAVH